MHEGMVYVDKTARALVVLDGLEAVPIERSRAKLGQD